MPSDENHAPLLSAALNIYRSAMDQYPDALSVRFNFVRAAFHFGVETDIEEALAVARQTLARNFADLSLDPLDDVMTWDYCPDFFNYRRYLQIATEASSGNIKRDAELKALLLASLNFYYGRMSDEAGYFTAAAALDPTFSAYRLWRAKELAGHRETAPEAIALLAEIVREILYATEAWSLMQSIKARYSVPIQNEEALGNLVVALEERTLIDESYTETRIGPYSRSQRLTLARNTGIEFVKRSERTTPPRLSVLLADTNGTRYADLLDSLADQTLDRGAYEIILCDVFDVTSPIASEIADKVMRCGQNEYLYNRNAAFNISILEATGAVVLFCNERRALPKDALGSVLERAEDAAANKRTVYVNAGGDTDGRDRICTVALTRDAAIDAGGLSESAYYAGAFSGPHELAARLRARHLPIVPLDFLPGPDMGIDASRHGAIERLYKEIWPSKFSPHRSMPLLENPDIARLRRQLGSPA